MPDGAFSVRLQKTADSEPREHGAETVEFLITTNPGQPPQPLSKVASGGELSRISLSIQVATIGLSMGLAFALGARPIVTHILAGHFLRQSLTRGTPVEVLGKATDRGVCKGIDQRNGVQTRILKPCDHLHQEQRVPADVEEVLVPSHRTEIEDLAPDPGDGHL